MVRFFYPKKKMERKKIKYYQQSDHESKSLLKTPFSQT